MKDDIETLSDSELLALPNGQVPPGALTLLWARKASVIQERDVEELNDELNGSSRSRRMIRPGEARDKSEERWLQELRTRQKDLLRQIDMEQERIRIEMAQLEQRTIHLHDGRKAYIDGTTYRDEAGQMLYGADHDEAEKQRHLHPDAATWTEKQKLEYRTEQALEMKNRVQNDAYDAEALSRDESEFARQAQEHAEKLEKTPDPYGSSDYSGIYENTTRTTSYAAKLNGQETSKLTQQFSPAVTGQGSTATEYKPETVPVSAPRQTFTR